MQVFILSQVALLCFLSLHLNYHFSILNGVIMFNYNIIHAWGMTIQ